MKAHFRISLSKELSKFLKIKSLKSKRIHKVLQSITEDNIDDFIERNYNAMLYGSGKHSYNMVLDIDEYPVLAKSKIKPVYLIRGAINEVLNNTVRS